MEIKKCLKKRQSSDPKLHWQDVLAEKLRWTFQPPDLELGKLLHKGTTELSVNATRYQLEILGFDDTYIDLIRALRLPQTRGKLQKGLVNPMKLMENVMGGGQILMERNQFIFKRGNEKYSMSQTAEGIKKIGILNRLIRNRLLNKNSILFLDEPEVNLHPKAIVSLVNLLFNLAQLGVQIYIATHSYFILKRFELLARQYNQSIPVCVLSRNKTQEIQTEYYNLADGMPPNPITDVSIELYEQEVKLDIES